MYYSPKESGQRIKETRLEKKMTQEQLAAKLMITPDALSKIERGDRGPSIDLLVDISTHLDVSIDYILLGRSFQIQKVESQIDTIAELLNQIKKGI